MVYNNQYAIKPYGVYHLMYSKYACIFDLNNINNCIYSDIGNWLNNTIGTFNMLEPVNSIFGYT